MHEYMEIHENADFILKQFTVDSTSRSRNQILGSMGLTKVTAGDINSILELLTSDGYLIRHDGNMFELSGMGRIFINKGGYKFKIQQDNLLEAEQKEDKKKQDELRQSVVDVNGIIADNTKSQSTLTKISLFIAFGSMLALVVQVGREIIKSRAQEQQVQQLKQQIDTLHQKINILQNNQQLFLDSLEKVKDSTKKK